MIRVLATQPGGYARPGNAQGVPLADRYLTIYSFNNQHVIRYY